MQKKSLYQSTKGSVCMKNKRKNVFIGILCVVVVYILLIVDPCDAGGLESSFKGSNFDGLTRRLTLCEYDGTLDGSGNLVDVSGENLVTYSEDLSNWTTVRTNINANAIKSPINELTADILQEDSTSGNTHYAYGTSVSYVAGNRYRYSVYARPINRCWARLQVNQTTTPYVYYDICNGVVGSETNGTGTIKKSVGGWYKITLDWIASNTESKLCILYIAEADGDVSFDGLDQDSIAYWGMHIRQVGNATPLPGQDNYIYTDADDKPRLTLASTNGPTTVYSDYQTKEGNRHRSQEFVFASSQYYSLAHDNVMNVFDTDHTITIAGGHTSISQSNYLFSHGAFNADGVYVYIATGRAVWYRFGKAGALESVYTGDVMPVGMYKTIHCVRSSNYGSIYINGSLEGGPVDVTGYGIDGNKLFVIGANSVLNSYGDSIVAYFRIDREALSADRLKFESDRINGVASGAGFQDPGWTFDRASTAYKTFSNGTMAESPDDAARVAGDGGGVLIESQGANLCEYSESWDDWPGTNRLSVSANTATAPNGELIADTLHEDNSLANSHFITSSGVSLTSGEEYTYSVYVKPINRDWVRLLSYATGFPNVYFNVANGFVGTENNGGTGSIQAMNNGWYRCSLTWTSSATETKAVTVHIAEGDDDYVFDGLDQDSLYVSQAQIENSPYPTSYILNLSTGTTTRTADDLTFDPHEANTTNYVLPLEFDGAEPPRDKLTIRFDAKALFSSSSDIDGYPRFVAINGNTGTTSNTRNRLRLGPEPDGKFNVRVNADSTTEYRIYTAANPVDYSEWHLYVVVIDFSSWANTELYIDGTHISVTTSGSGSFDFDTTDAMIRIGQTYIGDVDADFYIKNLEIIPGEYITP